MALDFLPISVRIRDVKILIVGGGRVATHKATILHRFTDEATVVAPEISEGLRQLPFHLFERPFQDNDLDGVQLLFICTGDRALNREIRDKARARGILSSVCDDPELCDFVSPAISYQEGDNLTISVGSDARDVHRSIRVRNCIQELIDNHQLNIE